MTNMRQRARGRTVRAISLLGTMLTACTTAAAQCQPDQSQLLHPSVIATAVGMKTTVDAGVGQTFTPTVTGRLDTVSVWVRDTTLSGKLLARLSFHDVTAGGVPIPGAVVSAYGAPATFSLPGAKYTFDLAPYNITVIAGQTYAFAVTCNSGNAFAFRGNLQFFGTSTSVYPAGSAFAVNYSLSTLSAPASFTMLPPRDLYFETCITPAATSFGGCGTVGCQTGRRWQLVQNDTASPGPSQPSRRVYPAMAYDPAADRTILFGGASTLISTTYLNDTWAFNPATGNWTKLTITSVSPPPRIASAMAFDPNRGRLILYGGGAPAPVVLDDMWELVINGNTGTWRQLLSAGTAVPAGRIGHSLVTTNNGVLMHGGTTNAMTLVLPNDTWLWRTNHASPRSANSWRHIATTLPPARFQHFAATWQSSPGAMGMLVSGGKGASNATITPNVSWWLNPATMAPSVFALLTPSAAPGWTGYGPYGSSPPPHQAGAAAGDTTWNQVMMFGGLNSLDQRMGATLIWDDHATPWQSHTPAGSPSPRFANTLAYDSVHDQYVLFGGSGASSSLNDTWVAPRCLGDYNGDWEITPLDDQDMQNAMNNGDPCGDLNCDGFVDLADYAIFLDAYTNGC